MTRVGVEPNLHSLKNCWPHRKPNGPMRKRKTKNANIRTKPHVAVLVFPTFAFCLLRSAFQLSPVGREVLESSSPGLQSGAKPSQLSTRKPNRFKLNNLFEDILTVHSSQKKPDVTLTPGCCLDRGGDRPRVNSVGGIPCNPNGTCHRTPEILREKIVLAARWLENESWSESKSRAAPDFPAPG